MYHFYVMTENNLDVRLKDKRFLMTVESRQIFDGLRAVFSEMQSTRSWLKGLGFFGSRTISVEKSNSDVDLYVFYDGDEYLEKGEVGRPIMRGGRLVVEKSKPRSRGFPKDMILSGLEIYLEKMVGRRYPIMRTKDGHDERWVGVDISKRQTDLDFDDFVKNANLEQPVSQAMIVRFLLSVGKPVYENRGYILDKIEKMDNPDYYVSALMNGLQEFERLKKREHAIAYEHYPRTLEEARKYFLVTLQDS